MPKLKEHMGFEIPTEGRAVFAKIASNGDKAESWYEVIFHYGDMGWYSPAHTNLDYNQVVSWVYADEILDSRPVVSE